jgi:amino acid adenylation domain-containing protein
VVDRTTVPALVAAQDPALVAVRCGTESLTYGELDDRAGRLASVLTSYGAGGGRVVAVALPRSAELVVVLLAVLRAGAVYLPLDLDDPTERTEFMLADADACLVVTDAASSPLTGTPRLLVDQPEVRALLAAAPAGDSVPTPADAAYLIYTSGSTGRPKGVLVPHQALVNYVRWEQSALALGPGERALFKTPLGFDVSVAELFGPLISGATVVMAGADSHRDPAHLAALIRQEQVTTAHFVPSVLRAVLDFAGPVGFPSLRVVSSGGETLPEGVRLACAERLDATLVNLYGPTETTVFVSRWICSAQDGPGAVPIGQPLWNCRVYVLDERMRPVVPGVAGELWVGGDQVALGYWRRPGLTADKFRPDPFGAVPGGRLYRTGDRVRRRDDGALEFLGRLDDQVKIRGVRIEPGEVEAVLATHPSVHDATVVVQRDGGGEPVLAGFVVSGAAVTTDELTAYLRESLPAHLVPRALHVVDRLPSTPSGKVDRRALSELAPAAVSTGHIEPLTPVQIAVAQVWAEVLGHERVGLHDSFFGLGGHSLLASKASALLSRRLGVEVPLRAFFRLATVAELAGEITAAR